MHFLSRTCDMMESKNENNFILHLLMALVNDCREIGPLNEIMHMGFYTPIYTIKLVYFNLFKLV